MSVFLEMEPTWAEQRLVQVTQSFGVCWLHLVLGVLW